MAALLVGALALPACLGLVYEKSNAEATRYLENRDTTPMPPLGLLGNDARAFIDRTDKHLRDTVHFRLPANALYRKMRYSVLGDSPLPNITIGRNEHIFVNAALFNTPYSYFEGLCSRQGDPSPELVRELDETLAAASRYFSGRGARVTFAIVPTTITLYADQMPLIVPKVYRRACLEYPQKDHLLARLERRGEAEGRYRVFYGHELFMAHRNEPHFYPKERYHCEGKSAHLFTRHLLKASGALDRLTLEEPAGLTDMPHDIAGFFGYDTLPVKAWSYPYPDQPTERRRVPWFLEAFGGRPDLLNHYATENSLTPKTALMIGNSFGSAIGDHLARGFRNLYFLNLNNFSQGQDRAAVFAAVAEHIRPDFVYFVFDDPNVTRLPEWLAEFVAPQDGETPSPSEKTGAPGLHQQS